MAKLSKMMQTPASQLFERIGGNLLQTTKGDVADQAVVGSVIGLEGYADPTAHGKRVQAEGKVVGKVRSLIAQEGGAFGVAAEDFSNAQLEAGAMILMAAGNPQAYAKAAMSENYPALESGDVDAVVANQGAGGMMDTGMTSIGLEYFTEQSLDKHMAASFRFNMQAARQDVFSETIMPTIVADPTEAGLLIEIKKTMVHRAVRHSIKDKDNKPYNRRNILDGATDASVLEDEAIIVVPYRVEDDSNASEFISTSLYTPRERSVGDYSVMTAPLAFGPKHNLLRLSAHPGLVTSGVLDESDELNGRVELSELYFTVGKAGGKAADRQLIRVNTTNRARSTFNKSQEGDNMEMQLTFSGSTFTLTGETKDVDGNVVLAADGLANAKYSLNYSVDVSNTLNLQTGAEKNMNGGVEILGLMDENKDAIGITKGAGKTLVDDLDIQVVAYNYAATRSNANRRTKGLLIDSVVERERYKIQLGSPLSSRKPIGREDNSQAIEDLITAARVRNSNQCVTKILNVTEVLKETVASIGEGNEYVVPSIEGVGRHYVRPWYDEANIDVNNLVSTLDSKDVDENLTSVILGIIREQVVRAVQESRFQPALEMLSGYTMSMPKVIIGTDIVIANWIERTADLRTLGDQFKYEVVTTPDNRWKGRIQWFFKVGEGEGGLNPLNFGNHIWVPELITDTNLTRNEGTANEVTVQPRNTHIVNCPITGVVNVKGIHELINGRTPQAVVYVKSATAAAGGSDLEVGDLVPTA